MSILDDELEERYPQTMGGGDDQILITRRELMDMQRAAYRAGAKRRRTENELRALDAGTDRGQWLDAAARMDAVLDSGNGA